MFLTGSQIYLRPLAIADADDFYQWGNDREVIQYSLSSFAIPKSLAHYQQWLSASNSGKSTIELGICCKETNKLIGYAGIAGISQLNRSGEYFILIGNKQYWGLGIASEVTRIVTQYGFETIGLHRIELTAFVENQAAVKAYTNAGYHHEGVKRQSGFRHGQFLDKVMMAVIAPQWLATNKSVL
ncbi:MAG: GNAT family N-acetyltransferase [Gammaproteobacteria bacterium]|nr:GNAT family N-acetyltransferase [Gammaproteobacteria bacterium]